MVKLAPVKFLTNFENLAKLFGVVSAIFVSSTSKVLKIYQWQTFFSQSYHWMIDFDQSATFENFS